jgi:hypothetical protein
MFPTREHFLLMGNATLILYMMLSVSNPTAVVEDVSLPENPPSQVQLTPASLLSSKTISLKDRNDVNFVNEVFKDNILLTLNYMNGDIKNKSDISWDSVNVPRTYFFNLQPGESFAFHDQILPEYNKNVVKTTNAHFNYQDGFKSDGYLAGDGVCHLASLMFWAAKDAGLEAYAPTDHDFAKINGVTKEFGVSIYNLPGSFTTGAKQNLYIQNNQDKTVTFVFRYDGNTLTINVERSNS